jgi:hypothetical protein
MSKNIDVVIYSYKGKKLKETVTNLKEMSSGDNKITVYVADQHPLDRTELFKSLGVTYYTHIFWDSQKSPCSIKNQAIRNSRADYILQLGDSVMLTKDWDRNLLNFMQDKNILISGNHSVKLSNENLFYIKVEKQDCEDFTITNYIDRDFIFATKKIFQFHMKYPEYLKYNGEEEVISLDMFSANFDIYSCPTKFFSLSESPTIGKIYTPFSLNHNYNEVVDLLNTGKSKFLFIGARKRSREDFETFHGVDLKLIKRLPFDGNDVAYDPEKLDFNKVDARRFVAKTKSIH